MAILQSDLEALAEGAVSEIGDVHARITELERLMEERVEDFHPRGDVRQSLVALRESLELAVMRIGWLDATALFDRLRAICADLRLQEFEAAQPPPGRRSVYARRLAEVLE